MADLIILGASGRAAAGSALRAGWQPWCADLFADADLRLMAHQSVRCPFAQYPSRLREILRATPDAPWIYTGALENHPKLIRAMADVRPLWGNGFDSLLAARSPIVIEQALRDAGLPALEVWKGGAVPPDQFRWLRKPLAGSAGNGIEFAEASHSRSSRHYFQRYVEGVPMSAIYVRSREGVRLLGMTEQLIGTHWLNASPFRYAGNIGPMNLTNDLRADLLRIGNVLGERCGLIGLFGIDFILSDGLPWVVEVNPRYTASIEVIEAATGVSALSLHAAVFEMRAMADVPQLVIQVIGKAIWYAPHRIVMPGYEMTNEDESFFCRIRWPGNVTGILCGDVPSPGEVIEAGWPVLTLFAEGDSRGECESKLYESANSLGQLLE